MWFFSSLRLIVAEPGIEAKRKLYYSDFIFFIACKESYPIIACSMVTFTFTSLHNLPLSSPLKSLYLIHQKQQRFSHLLCVCVCYGSTLCLIFSKEKQLFYKCVGLWWGNIAPSGIRELSLHSAESIRTSSGLPVNVTSGMSPCPTILAILTPLNLGVQVR